MNPLLQTMQQQLNSNNPINDLYKMYKNGGNPLSLMQGNPQFAPIMNMIQSGADPQKLFYDMCKQRNVDPNSILNQFK